MHPKFPSLNFTFVLKREGRINCSSPIPDLKLRRSSSFFKQPNRNVVFVLLRFPTRMHALVHGASPCSFGPTREMPAWDDFVAPANRRPKGTVPNWPRRKTTTVPFSTLMENEWGTHIALSLMLQDQPSYLLFEGQMIFLNIFIHKGNQTTGHRYYYFEHLHHG